MAGKGEVVLKGEDWPQGDVGRTPVDGALTDGREDGGGESMVRGQLRWQ